MDLERLRRLMIANGMLRSQGSSAASFEIIPFSDLLFDPEGEMNQVKPPDNPAEGGGTCGTCQPGCKNGGKDSCTSGCADGCEVGCSDSTF
jgi:hypothetical protein